MNHKPFCIAAPFIASLWLAAPSNGELKIYETIDLRLYRDNTLVDELISDPHLNKGDALVVFHRPFGEVASFHFAWANESVTIRHKLFVQKADGNLIKKKTETFISASAATTLNLRKFIGFCHEFAKRAHHDRPTKMALDYTTVHVMAFNGRLRGWELETGNASGDKIASYFALINELMFRDDVVLAEHNEKMVTALAQIVVAGSGSQKN